MLETPTAVAQREYAVLIYRKGRPAGWYLNGCLLTDSPGRSALDCLDSLHAKGWEFLLYSRSAYYLMRSPSTASLARE